MHKSPYGRPHRRAKSLLDPPSGPCPYCGEPMLTGEDLDADHAVPRVLGGTGLLRWAHARCNRRAGAELRNRLHGHRRDEPDRWVDRWA